MEDARKFVAVGLLTRSDLDILGAGFHTAFPVESYPAFDDLLRKIDAAEEASTKMNLSRQSD